MSHGIMATSHKDTHAPSRMGSEHRSAAMSRTQKLLVPGVVTSALGLLGLLTIVSIALVGSTLASKGSEANGVGAAQVLLMIACTFSISYTGFHIAAAVLNKPVGVVRPPALRLHACCFIVARVSLFAWFVAMIAISVVASRPSTCVEANSNCRLQKVEVAGSIVAMLLLTVLMTALETCEYPFEPPELLRTNLTTVRVSAYMDNFKPLHRSVSQVTVHREQGVYSGENRTGLNPAHRVKRKPVPQPVPGSWPSEPERPITPLLPVMQNPRDSSWGEDCLQTLEGNASRLKRSESSDSSIAMSIASVDTSSSFFSYMERPSVATMAKHGVSTRSSRYSGSITPSTSISSLSARSSRSVIRSSARPNMKIGQPEYLPPKTQHGWDMAQKTSICEIQPMAHIRSSQRVVYDPASYRNRPRGRRDPPPTFRLPPTATTEREVPNPTIFVPRQNPFPEVVTEGIPEAGQCAPPFPHPRRGSGIAYNTSNAGSRARYQDQRMPTGVLRVPRPLLRRSSGASNSQETRSESESMYQVAAAGGDLWRAGRVGFQPLSLTGFSPALGKIWEV